MPKNEPGTATRRVRISAAEIVRITNAIDFDRLAREHKEFEASILSRHRATRRLLDLKISV